jgi:zinc transporter ZupT
MISFTPYYIVVGEAGIAVALTLLALQLRRATWKNAAVAGVIGGLAIFICYALAYLVTDGLHNAR